MDISSNGNRYELNRPVLIWEITWDCGVNTYSEPVIWTTSYRKTIINIRVTENAAFLFNLFTSSEHKREYKQSYNGTDKHKKLDCSN